MRAYLLIPILALGLSGCRLLGLNAHGFAAAWDNYRCDRRVGVIANLQLNTDPSRGRDSSEGTSSADYNRVLAFFHDRKVSEVIFEGRTTLHGTLAEFRALNAGFSAIPDPAYRHGRATVTWNVKRTYRFAPEDAQGKYHPSTFWPRIFNAPWSDSYVSPAVHMFSEPTFLIRNYYGDRCHVQHFAFVAHVEEKNGEKKTSPSWDVVTEWDEEAAR